MGLNLSDYCPVNLGQEGGFVPLCPAGRDAGQSIHKSLISNVSRWIKYRDKAHSCPEIPPFPFLGREGGGTGPGQNRYGGLREH